MAVTDEVLRILFQTVADTAGAEQAALVVQKVATQLKAEAATAKEAAAAEQALAQARREASEVDLATRAGSRQTQAGALVEEQERVRKASESARSAADKFSSGVHGAGNAAVGFHEALQSVSSFASGNFAQGLNKGIYALQNLAPVFQMLGRVAPAALGAAGAAYLIFEKKIKDAELAEEVRKFNEETRNAIASVQELGQAGETISPKLKRMAEAMASSKGLGEELAGLARNYAELDRRASAAAQAEIELAEARQRIAVADLEAQEKAGKISETQARQAKLALENGHDELRTKIANTQKNQEIIEANRRIEESHAKAEAARKRAAEGTTSKEDAQKASDEATEVARTESKRIADLQREIELSNQLLPLRRKLRETEAAGETVAANEKSAKEIAKGVEDGAKAQMEAAKKAVEEAKRELEKAKQEDKRDGVDDDGRRTVDGRRRTRPGAPTAGQAPVQSAKQAATAAEGTMQKMEQLLQAQSGSNQMTTAAIQQLITLMQQFQQQLSQLKSQVSNAASRSTR